jgi:hypothetical protein
MVSIHLECNKFRGLYQVEFLNNKPYPMKEITNEENENLMYVLNITKPAVTIYLTDAEMIWKEKR